MGLFFLMGGLVSLIVGELGVCLWSCVVINTTGLVNYGTIMVNPPSNEFT